MTFRNHFGRETTWANRLESKCSGRKTSVYPNFGIIRK